MLQKWICIWTVSFSLVNPAFSEEPPATPAIRKQRVSPKLLREAMASPEYKAKVRSATNVPSVEPLQRLSEKLKSTGDQESCDILQRFIQEHQQVVSQSVPNPGTEKMLKLRCQMIDVNLNEIPKDSILHAGVFSTAGVLEAQSVEAFGKELYHAVKAKQATRLFEPVSLSAPLNEKVHFHQGGEIPLPSSDGSPAKKFQEIGTIINAVVTPVTQDVNRIDLSIEIIRDVETDVPNSPDSLASQLTHRKMQTVVEAESTESSIVATPWGEQGHKVFLITKVTAKK